LESNVDNKFRTILKNPGFKRIDRKIMLYLVFVAISTAFWFLYEFSNDYTTTVNYPVRFTNLPQNKALVCELPEELTLNVNAYGFTLLRYKLNPSPFPLIINMEEYGSNVSSPNIKQFKLLTRYVRETISKQMPDDIEILDISPDTIIFQFATIVSKKIPIKPHIKLDFDEECMLNGEVLFTPDSVLVKGPSIILDTLTAVYCKFEEFDGLKETMELKVELSEINNLVFDVKKAVMQLPVSKFTQATFEVPIQSKNLPDSLDLKTFPRIAKITCLIALNEYDKVGANDFVALVDYADVINLLGNKLHVQLELVPVNVKSVTCFPESVEFILDKKP